MSDKKLEFDSVQDAFDALHMYDYGDSMPQNEPYYPPELKCECGAATVYGEDTTFHAYYCPRYTAPLK